MNGHTTELSNPENNFDRPVVVVGDRTAGFVLFIVYGTFGVNYKVTITYKYII